MMGSSSILQYPDDDAMINPPPSELQVWNNAAFDNGESEDSISVVKSSSWWNQSLESSSCSKENMSPVCEKSSSVVSFNSSSVSSMPIKPLASNTIIANSQGNGLSNNNNNNPLKIVLKQGGFASKNVVRDDERKIDKEIEEIEKEISRLSSRLEALRLEKAERSLKISEKRGRIVPAKFMEPKQTVKIEDPPKINRRGVSLGPSEIYSATNKARLLSKQEMATPASIKNRRKSCFWKLEEIDELKATKERGKSLSVSPRSRKNALKIQAPKMAATTVGSRKLVRKEDGVLASIQPKTLFKDGEKSVPNKKPLKPGRVVASRYNQSNGNCPASDARKRSLPDSDKEDGNKRRASRENGVNQRMESSTKVKKKWEIPSELVVVKSDADVILEESLASKTLMADVLPKINTFRRVIETPRDSGAVKRVADLAGKKSFFSIDEGEEAAGDSVCQALRFDFEEDEDNDVMGVYF